MHRSGTSLTASWLRECGLTIDAGRLMGGSEGNLLGHFEDLDFVNLHSRILLNKNSVSMGWKIDHFKEFYFSESDMNKVYSIINSRNESYKTWGWKDPRSVLFLTAWKNIIPNLKFIFTWREAHEVVSSLRKRYKRSKNEIDKISINKSYITWATYNNAILNFIDAYREDCLLINIKDLMNDDKFFFDNINSKLNLDLKYSSIDNLLEENLMSSHDLSWMDKINYRLYNLEVVEKRLSNLSIIK